MILGKPPKKDAKEPKKDTKEPEKDAKKAPKHCSKNSKIKTEPMMSDPSLITVDPATKAAAIKKFKETGSYYAAAKATGHHCISDIMEWVRKDRKYI